MPSETSKRHRSSTDGLMMMIKREATGGEEGGVKPTPRERGGGGWVVEPERRDNEGGESWMKEAGWRLNRDEETETEAPPEKPSGRPSRPP